MGQQLLGRATIKVDGTTLDTMKGATLDIGGEKRTTVIGRKVSGYTSEPAQSKLDCEIVIPTGFSVAALSNITNATLNFEADTGQTWIVRGAWRTDTTTITEGDGKAKLTFEGPPAEEML